MKVRLLKPWSRWSVGHVFRDMAGGQARTLISHKIAEEVKDEPVVARSILRSPVDRMMKRGQVVDRGN